MVLEAFFNQGLIVRRQRRVIQFQGATNQQLPFGNCQRWQFCQNFRETHASN